MSKNSGMTRPVDRLGRIVIPKEMRATLHINDGDLLEIAVLNSRSMIIKTKNVPSLDEVLEDLEAHASAYGLLQNELYLRIVEELNSLKGESKMNFSIEENNLLYCCLKETRLETLQTVISIDVPEEMKQLKKQVMTKLYDMSDYEFNPNIIRNNYVSTDDK